jgi:DNA-directed RNA polymerase subunit RPC12/RpoP
MDHEGMMEYYCNKCGVVLARPIETSANYCYDPKTERTFLVCNKCKRKRDRVIW